LSEIDVYIQVNTSQISSWLRGQNLKHIFLCVPPNPKKDTLFCLLLYACQQWRAHFHRKHWQLQVGKSQWSDRKIHYLPVEQKIRKTVTCNKQELTFPLETSTTSNQKTTTYQPSSCKIKARWQRICQKATLSSTSFISMKW